MIDCNQFRGDAKKQIYLQDWSFVASEKILGEFFLSRNWLRESAAITPQIVPHDFIV